MPKTKISEFSATPANNTDIDSINIAEGCAPSGINDAIRELMAQLKDFQTGAVGDSFNGPVGTSTAAAGAFTTLSASSTLGVTGVSTLTGGAVVQGLTVGKGAGAVSTTTAVGVSALAANSSGGNNVAIGYQAGLANSTGGQSTLIGSQAGLAGTDLDYVTAVGYQALSSVTSGDFNTALGAQALKANTSGANCTASGYRALYNNTTGSSVTAFGYQAGNATISSNSSTYIGANSGLFTTGTFNSFLGQGSGEEITTGTRNTIIGRYTGNQGGLDARTRNNEVILSDGDGNIMYRANGTSTSNRWVNNDGTQFYPGTDNVISLGFSSNRWTTVYATTGTINTSDANQKQDIANLDDAEKRVAVAIKSLIKKYRFKDAVAKKGDAARIHVGAVAQEVQAAFVAEGLDPARYALFCSDTWYEVDGKPSNTAIEPYTADTPNSVQVTQLGLRYEELLAFVIAAL